jgi:protein involved in polysaccharide export with SLBB domain
LAHKITLAFALVAVLIAGLIAIPASSQAQMTSEELYNSFKNSMGVADTATEKILARRQTQTEQTAQALEAPVDPDTYQLGPGDGVYLVVYSIHGIDQDLMVTPEGQLLIPNVGAVQVSGITVTEAQKRVKAALSKDFKSPEVSLSLRKLRPIKVNVIGNVLSPGMQSATVMQRVSEVIDHAGGFKTNSSLRNIEIRTLTGNIRAHADLVRYYAIGDLNANPALEAGEVIDVPTAKKYTLVAGSVATPQRIEFVNGDSLSTALALCGGLLPGSNLDSIEIARFPDNDPVHAQWIWVNYAHGENPLLHEGDQIFVRAYSQFHVPRIVSIGGQVPFPGDYPIQPGTTRLKDILEGAGGILPNASLDQARLIRRAGVNNFSNDLELQRIQTLSNLRKEGLTDEQYNYYASHFLMFSMVVDFKALLNGDQSQNILMREEDSIYIPRAMGFVTVSGSVIRQGNVEFIQGGTWQDYINKAGGFASDADRSAIRVVNPQTGSYTDPRSESNYGIESGDMIIVPREEPHFWKDVAAGALITAQIITILAGVIFLVKNGL